MVVDERQRRLDGGAEDRPPGIVDGREERFEDVER
jgi:hypothetical protein